MQADESATVETLNTYRTAMRRVIERPCRHPSHCRTTLSRRRSPNDAALAGIERALALNPNDPDVLCLSASVNAWSGKWERSIALSKKAMVLTPNYPRWCHFPIGAHLYLKGEYEQSLAESLKIELPDYYRTQVFLAMNYGQLGRKDEAGATIARLLKLYPGFGANARRELRKYNLPHDYVEHYVAGLRKVGPDVPSE